MNRLVSSLAVLLPTVLLTACGPDNADLTVVRQRMQSAREHYNLAADALQANRLGEAGDEYLRLHAIARSVKRRDWDVFIGQSNVVGEAGNLEATFRTHVRRHLPNLEQAFLNSEIPWTELATFIHRVGIDEWDNRIESLRHQAIAKAAGELRIVQDNSLASPELRRTVTEALLAKSDTLRLNTGYGLDDAPSGLGRVLVSADITYHSYDDPDTGAVYRVPEEIKLSVRMQTETRTTWGDGHECALSYALPSKLVILKVKGPEAADAMAEKALTSMAGQAREAIAEWPVLRVVE